MVSYITPSPLCEELARGGHSQCCYSLLKMRYLSISVFHFISWKTMIGTIHIWNPVDAGMGDQVKNGKNSDGSGWLQGGSSNINEAIRGVLNFFFFTKRCRTH